MDNLIKETLEKVSGNRKIYENGEYAVRDHLINPILNYLGWNTSNPKFVIPNLTTVDRDIPDYTLFKNGMKILFVEAKNLSVDLKNEIQQLAKYCYYEGTEFGVLTNGINWILFRTFLKGTTLKERIIWEIDFEKDSEELITSKLKTVHYNNIENLEKLIKKDKILDNAWQNFLNNPDCLLSKFGHIFKESIDVSSIDTEFQDEEVESYLKLRFRELIASKTQCYENENPNQARSTTPSVNKKKTPTPSVSDWIKKIPELSRVGNLNSWKDICNYLKIEVGGDSATRVLRRWVKDNKPNWSEIPEP